MRGDLYTGWVTLSDGFPCTLNSKNDPTLLKSNETPAAYGIDPSKDGLLAYLATCPVGTARTAPTNTVGSTTYNWYFDRNWRASSAQLIYGAPYYDKVFHEQGISKVIVPANIVTFMPCLQSDMWVLTGTGSVIINNAISHGDRFVHSDFIQGLYASSATYANTLDGMPVVCNDKGVFSFDGNKVTEVTYPVRDSIGSFANTAILIDYPKKWIIGTSKFVIDVPNKKLFDFGTAGFLYTSRTLVQGTGKAGRPFMVVRMAMNYEFDPNDLTDATIEWQTKAEDEDWYDEEDIVFVHQEGEMSRKLVEITNTTRSAHKYAIRITSMSANLRLRAIEMEVNGWADNTPTA